MKKWEQACAIAFLSFAQDGNKTILLDSRPCADKIFYLLSSVLWGASGLGKRQ